MKRGETMSTLSRGFRGRERSSVELPPGQYLVEDFPVLSAGPTPAIDLADWELVITSETDEQRRWDWDGLRALPSETVTVDLHCVTHWSKPATTWEGVSLDTLLEGLDTGAGFALVTSYGGYTTNLPLEDLTDHQAWVAFGYDGAELAPEQGGPGRAAGAAAVSVEERHVGPGDRAAGHRRARLLGGSRLPPLRRPLAGAAVLGRLRMEAAMTSSNTRPDRPDPGARPLQ
jgi:DMSO/TMAO reductase YedYZ molybdopterin-dependent catalytic subunit